jgi:metal-responsive CopG/Arc/MetJ family transcriptional regulator
MKNDKQINISLPAELAEELLIEANNKGLSRSAFLRSVIIDLMKQKNNINKFVNR